jgi:asparagine synthase (glutamine-hydrolysing)
MFAFAIFDRTEGKLVLARDRLGIKPMYWCAVDSDLVFGSEARSVLEVAGSAAAPDPESVAGYLSWGVVPGPRTIFCGVSSLPPGSFLEWRSGAARVKSWWRPRIESRIDNPYEAEGAVADALADSIRRHLIADRPVGLFLSSGVDSGAVATVAASQGAIRGITVAFPEAHRSEAESATALAARLGVEHERVDITGQEVLRCLPRILQQMDQPTSDGVNTWLVSRAAKSAGFVVALSGLGGDEVFGGYPSFRLVPLLSRAHTYVGWIPDRIRNGASQFAGWWAPGGRLTRALAGNSGYPGYYRAVRGLFSDPEVRGAWEVQSPGSGSETLIVGQRGRLEDADLVTLLEMSRYLPDQLLRDTDQMSMAHSLEVRVPLLDHQLIDVAFSVTARVRTAPGKQLLIRAADMGSANPKVPFAPPFDEWIRGPLRGFVREGLLSDRLPFSDHMSRGFRERLWARLQQGRVHWSRPWAVAVLRSWAEINGFGWV